MRLLKTIENWEYMTCPGRDVKLYRVSEEEAEAIKDALLNLDDDKLVFTSLDLHRSSDKMWDAINIRRKLWNKDLKDYVVKPIVNLAWNKDISFDEMLDLSNNLDIVAWKHRSLGDFGCSTLLPKTEEDDWGILKSYTTDSIYITWEYDRNATEDFGSGTLIALCKNIKTGKHELYTDHVRVVNKLWK